MEHHTRITLLVLALGTPALTASADRVHTRAELDDILSGSEEYLEDFEEVSFHSGSQMPLPNPFNHVTGAPLGWGDLIPGVSYASTGDLTMYAWYLYGDDSNILTGTGDVTITFDEPQLAVGFDLDGGAATIHQVLTVLDGDKVLDTWAFDMAPAETLFVGWQHPAGMTALRIESSAGRTEVDNVGWGVVVTDPCPADVDDSGTVDFQDLLHLLADWGDCTCASDIDGDETVDFADLLLLLAAWGPCPGP